MVEHDSSVSRGSNTSNKPSKPPKPVQSEIKSAQDDSRVLKLVSVTGTIARIAKLALITLFNVTVGQLKPLQMTIQTERGDGKNLEQDLKTCPKRQFGQPTYKSLQRRSKPPVLIPSANLKFVSIQESMQQKFSLQSKCGKIALTS